jgi:signal transduction histidine kinase
MFQSMSVLRRDTTLVGKTINVLLVEANTEQAQLVQQELQKSCYPFTIQQVQSLALAKEQLVEQIYDVVLLDLSLPDSSGLETLMELRSWSEHIPIIVLTGPTDREAGFQSLDQGAQDYLLKGDYANEALSRSIRNAIHRQQMFELLEKKNRRLTELFNTAQQFVDNVSHEFRTPLTVIKEFTLILREGLAGPLTEQQCKYLDIVADRVTDLTLMVNDMLDTSKLEVGLLGLVRHRCWPHEILDRVRSMIERKAAANNITLVFDLDEDLPAVYCDPEKIGRVLINLTVNAIKFSREGGRVRLWGRPDVANAEVILGVSDDGPGIDPKNLEAIFERFRQLPGNVKASTQGVGLGLSIAKELVHLNLGTIAVASQTGQGSTFSFTIPTADPVNVLEHYFTFIQGTRTGSPFVSLVEASIEASVQADLAEEMNEFLQHLMRRNDLVFRTDLHRWLLVLTNGIHELHGLLKRIRRARHEANRNRPKGELPRIRFDVKGSWSLAHQQAEIERCFRNEVHSLEAAPA